MAGTATPIKSRITLRRIGRSARRLLFLAALGVGIFGAGTTARAGTYLVTDFSDSGDTMTLRWAINQANADPGSTIILIAAADRTSIALGSALPNITAGVTIQAVNQPVTISGSTQIFSVNASGVVLQDLTVSNAPGSTVMFLAGGATSIAVTQSLTGGGTQTINGVVTDSALAPGGITKTGSGTLVLTGDNTYHGTTTISEGTLQVGNGGAAGGVQGNIVNGGTLDIERTGTWSYGGSLTGSGSTQIKSGGTFSLTGDSSAYAGQFLVFNGTAQVAGGGSLHTGDSTFVGLESGGTGAIRVTGANSVWNSDSDIFLSLVSAATLDIAAGGVINSVNATVGYSANSTVTVAGQNSLWNNSGGLVVGLGSTATMTISDQGEVRDTQGTVGQNAGSSGTVTVTGAGSKWTNSQSVTVGSEGNGVATVSAGGHAGSAGLVLAKATGTTGSLTVTGDGSAWVSTQDLSVGQSGTGTLAIADKGTVEASTTHVGQNTGATGTVTVDGAGSGLTTHGQLLVGEGGTGSVTVKNGGSVTVDSSIGLGLQPGVQGTLDVGDFSGGTTGGTVTAASLFGGGGVAMIRFNQTDTATFDFELDGSVSVLQRGTGTSVLSGTNTYTGGTVVSAGVLVAAGNGATGTGITSVTTGGTLLVKEGKTLTGPVVLAGGVLQHEVGAGSSLAHVADATSSFAGGTADTTAEILGGTSSAIATLQASFAATSTALNDAVRLSDVYQFSGMPTIGPGETDWFVLQLTVAGMTGNDFLGWLDTSTNTWVNAVEGNIGGTAVFAGDRAYDALTDFQLGTYGINTATGSAWAVVNHNSAFGVVPEPSTYALVALGLAVVGLRLRRRVA